MGGTAGQPLGGGKGGKGGGGVGSILDMAESVGGSGSIGGGAKGRPLPSPIEPAAGATTSPVTVTRPGDAGPGSPSRPTSFGLPGGGKGSR